jgi:DNA polymerase III delta prime subunit
MYRLRFDDIIWKTIPDLSIQRPPDNFSKWCIYHASLSSLPIQNVSGTEDAVNLFMRVEANSLWEALQSFDKASSKTKTLWLSGPPGIGKSTLLFGWARYIATNRKCLFVWVHCSGDDWHVTKMSGTTAEYTRINSTLNSAVDLICGFCENAEYVVLDAVRNKMTSLLLAMRSRSNVKDRLFLIASTSYCSGGLSSEESIVVNYDTYVMRSWTLQQYEDGKEVLFPGTTVEFVRELFCFGGGSLRLLLYLNTRRIKSFLNEKLQEVLDPTPLLTGLAGMKTSLHVNSLMQLLDSDDSSLPVSEYVKHQLVRRCGLTFVNAAKNFLPNNPSYQGWIFELEFVTRLHLASKSPTKELKMKSVSATPDSFVDTVLKINHIEEYSQDNAKEWKIPVAGYGNTIYLPIKWNQGCFDAVYHWMKDDIPCFAFIQCTISKHHDYKLKFVGEFLSCLFQLPGGVRTRQNEAKPCCEVYFWVVVEEKAIPSYRHGIVDNLESVQIFDPNFVGFEDPIRTLIGYLVA